MNIINCKELCVNGCILVEQCPHRQYLAATQKFMQDTSLDKMLKIAADRFAPPNKELDEDKE